MLVQKLLRIEDTMIQEIEELAEKISKKEYTSFSSLVRMLLRKGLNNMPKSIINSDEVKNLVMTTMNKALEECALQQEANGQPYEGWDFKTNTSMGMLEPDAESKKFSETKPSQVKITVEFYFGEETHGNKYGKLVCTPIIDLTNVK